MAVKPIIVYGNCKDQIVSAITQWDERQSKRDKYHNPHFLGIALQVFNDESAEAEAEANPRQFILRNFNGRLRAFIVKALQLEPLTKEEERW